MGNRVLKLGFAGLVIAGFAGCVGTTYKHRDSARDAAVDGQVDGRDAVCVDARPVDLAARDVRDANSRDVRDANSRDVRDANSRDVRDATPRDVARKDVAPDLRPTSDAEESVGESLLPD
jgi:hypothetical protein